MTHQDLNLYLGMIDSKINHYKVEQSIRPSDYNEQMIKELDKMAVQVINRFHNPQDEHTLQNFHHYTCEPCLKIVESWYAKRWINYPTFLKLTNLPF